MAQNDEKVESKYVFAFYADDTTLYSGCGRSSDLWQQLELASELESDLRHMVGWGKKLLVDFNAGKTRENPLLRCWD